MTYKLAFYNKNSRKDWQKLPENIKDLFKKHLKKRMDNPHVTSARLGDDLEGCYKIKLRKEGYRLVY
ncbi:hypothetical protein DA717_13030 [Piscirickettsiaceae bacterium NZ-RLO2]|nr:hypothetical protein DA717_13030 [Piscirickettsiaceae bacterium NZ-RLO2]